MTYICSSIYFANLYSSSSGWVMMGSSSDSDAGERARNVKFVLVKSEESNQETDTNYAYKRKLGDLIFNANYEAGNLGHVERMNMFDYDLMVRPDVANPRYCLWFNFTVSNQLPNQVKCLSKEWRQLFTDSLVQNVATTLQKEFKVYICHNNNVLKCVIFTFVNLDPLRLFHEGLTPVVRTRLQPNWVRLHEDQVFYYKSSDHGDRYVLSLAFRFSTYDDEHQFAMFYPYSYTNLARFIARSTVELKRKKKQLQKEASVQRKPAHRLSPQPYHHYRIKDQTTSDQNPRSKSSLGFRTLSFRSNYSPHTSVDDEAELKMHILCSSILSKSVNLLLITSSTSKSLIAKPRVIVLCRPSGNLDSVASLVCQGMMDFLQSNDQVAKSARRSIDFYFVPMSDPDSVYVGNSRSDIMGQTRHTLKLIRANSRVYAHLNAIKYHVDSILKHATQRVVLIELKVNLLLIGSRLVGKKFTDGHRMEKHLCLSRLLSKFADDFYLENCVFVESLPGFLETSGSNVDHYWFEVSPFAHYKRSLLERNYQEYNQTKYILLGKMLLLSLFELLRPVNSEIPTLASFYPKSDDIDELVLKAE